MMWMPRALRGLLACTCFRREASRSAYKQRALLQMRTCCLTHTRRCHAGRAANDAITQGAVCLPSFVADETRLSNAAGGWRSSWVR